MKKSIIKKSDELNVLLDKVYDKYAEDGQALKFKNFAKKISDVYFENDYLGVLEYANCGSKITQTALTANKPVYHVLCSRWHITLFIINTKSAIKKILNDELVKYNNSSQIKNILSSINSLDASILAFIALSPKPIKDISILNFLSKDTVLLGKCLMKIKGNYPAKIKNSAKVYSEWAIYKNKLTPKRNSLILTKIVK
jgi:hypothetical protein